MTGLLGAGAVARVQLPQETKKLADQPAKNLIPGGPLPPSLRPRRATSGRRRSPGLSVTWHVEWLEEYRHLPENLVTFQLDPLGEVVRLTTTESHQEPMDEKILEGGRRGWPVILSGLKSLLETETYSAGRRRR